MSRFAHHLSGGELCEGCYQKSRYGNVNPERVFELRKSDMMRRLACTIGGISDWPRRERARQRWERVRAMTYRGGR